MHHDEPGLFMLPDVAPIPVAMTVPSEPMISEQQVVSIKEAFTSAGIQTMQARQELIQSCVVRPVGNIRELYARDVRRILKRIQERTRTPVVDNGSAWDNRDEDTWIDKL